MSRKRTIDPEYPAIKVSWHPHNGQWQKVIGKYKGKDGIVRPKQWYLGVDEELAKTKAQHIKAAWQRVKIAGNIWEPSHIEQLERRGILRKVDDPTMGIMHREADAFVSLLQKPDMSQYVLDDGTVDREKVLEFYRQVALDVMASPEAIAKFRLDVLARIMKGGSLNFWREMTNASNANGEPMGSIVGSALPQINIFVKDELKTTTTFDTTKAIDAPADTESDTWNEGEEHEQT